MKNLTEEERAKIAGRLLGYTHDIQMESEESEEGLIPSFKCVKCGKYFHPPFDLLDSILDSILDSMTLTKWWIGKEKEPCIK